MLQCVSREAIMLQSLAVCCSALHCDDCGAMQRDAVFGSVLQCVAGS